MYVKWEVFCNVRFFTNIYLVLLFIYFFQISSSVANPSDLVKLIPAALANYIPKSLLIFEGEKLSVEDLNSKMWTREQVIF